MIAKWGKFQFTFTPLGLIKYSFLTVGIIAVLWATAIFFSYGIVDALHRHTAAEKYAWTLENFQTFTVETSFEYISPKNVLGYNEDAVSNLALKEISSRVEERFGKGVASSRYGKPYTFETNPLNLAITFTIYKIDGNPPKFFIGATFERSFLLGLARGDTDTNAVLKRKVDRFMQSGEADFSQPFYRADFDEGVRSGPVLDGNELIKRISFLSDAIVKDMKPRNEIAEEMESNLKAKRHSGKR